MIAVRRPAIRERVPRAEYPNFRDDAGGSVTSPLLRLLQNLQRGRGEAWASEASLRQMICQDTGHMPGVGTVPAALDRLQAHGFLEQVWIVAGSMLPNGESAHHGTRGIHVAVNRAERHAIRSANRHRRYRPRRLLRSVELAQEAIGRVATPRQALPNAGRETSTDPFASKRAADLARLAELAATWKDDPPKE